MRKETDKQVNITMSAEDKEQLLAFCAETGLSVNQALNRGRELLLVDSMKAKAPDQAASIEDFEANLNKLLVSYRASIEHSINAKAVAEAEVKGQLDGMSKLVEANEKLQEKNNLLIEENSRLKASTDEQSKKIDALENELASARIDKEHMEMLSQQLIQLKEEKAELIEQHNIEISKLQNDNFEKIIKVIKAGNSPD